MNTHMLRLFAFALLLNFFAAQSGYAQERSVVVVHTDKGSGYGVAWGGPDKVVTVLHVVAGVSSIQVNWEGKTSAAVIEKIYKPSDLALLSLKTPLGIPQIKSYSGEAPLRTAVQYWVAPPGARMTAQNTQLEKKSTLDLISPRVDAAGFNNMLCSDGSGTFPSTNTTILKFSEANIAKSHSGSPITYGTDILGLIDGGSKVPSTMVWAIPCSEFNKLNTSGSAPTQLVSCANSKYMYAGMRSDNPLLDEEHLSVAKEIESAQVFKYHDKLLQEYTLKQEYRIRIGDLKSTGFESKFNTFMSLFQPMEKSIRDQAPDNPELWITEEEMLQQELDIFREEKTGALIAKPHTVQIGKSDSAFIQTRCGISSPKGGVKLNFVITHGYGKTDAIMQGSVFWNGLKKMKCPTEPSVDEDYTESEHPYYRSYANNPYVNSEGQQTGMFYCAIVINVGDFFGLYLDLKDTQTLTDRDERMAFYAFYLSALLADFPIN